MIEKSIVPSKESRTADDGFRFGSGTTAGKKAAGAQHRVHGTEKQITGNLWRL